MGVRYLVYFSIASTWRWSQLEGEASRLWTSWIFLVEAQHKKWGWRVGDKPPCHMRSQHTPVMCSGRPRRSCFRRGVDACPALPLCGGMGCMGAGYAGAHFRLSKREAGLRHKLLICTGMQ